jgi:hypothetical protein
MKVKYGEGTTEYGPGVSIQMTGNEVATAILTYLVARDVNISGSPTVLVNGALCDA